ncbi:MAG: DUF3284 domain-containing protein [Candidatus Saccharimonadales bacterium]
MHKKSHTVIIDKPVHETFLASLNPKNTPLWIEGMVEEQASEFPPKLGTLYKNRGETGGWTEYSITEFESDKVFTLSQKDGAYHVRYVFKPQEDNQTELTYTEWEDNGTLESPLPESAIQKLKELIEKS